MIRRVSFLTFSLLAASLLHAEVPSSVLFQGYLTNNDAPVNGSQTLLVKACDALVDGNCKTVFNGKVQASNGYYTALLQNLPNMDKPYWLEVVSNGSLLSERIALTATPYALRAAVADSSAKVGTATKAIFADSATGAVRSTSALTALNADLATRAKLADSAIAALQAVNATLAAKATLADSAISALRAVNATLAAKALFADSATGTVRAVSAINATNATNAVNAVNATNATLATKAILADSATGAVRAVTAINATNATNAVNAINATNATLAAKAILADSATGAVRAVSAINATNATYATSMDGITAKTDSLKISKPNMKFTGAARSELLNESLTATGGKRAGIDMDLTSTSTLHLYAAGWGGGGGASSSLDITPAGISTSDPMTTGSLTSSGLVTAKSGLMLTPIKKSALPACTYAIAGTMFMLEDYSGSTYTNVSLAYCWAVSNPGGSNYGWRYLPAGSWTTLP